MQLAKLIGDIATGQTKDEMPEPSKDEIRRVMSLLGKLGGPKGGAARAANLSARRRKEIAQLAARKRWAKKNGSNSMS
jgi:hypothetical protein